MAPLGRPGDQGDELSWMGVSVLYRRNRSAKKAYFLFTVIVLVIIGVLAAYLTPRGLSLYYQMRGGAQLARVLEYSTDSPQNDFLCEPLAENNQQGKAQLNTAEKDLTTAISMNPRNSQAHLQLGRVQCLAGYTEKARSHFNKYAELRPGNPLGYMISGFASERLCDSKAAKQSWIKAGISAEDFQMAGDKAFEENELQSAKDWYIRSIMVNPNYEPSWVGFGKAYDLINNPVDTNSDDYPNATIIESFIDTDSWFAYPNNIDGVIKTKNGIMEMSYKNSPEKRDFFSFSTYPDRSITGNSELLIRANLKTGTLLTVETVIDGNRIRKLNYETYAQGWNLISVPISGNHLKSITISISERSKEGKAKEHSILLDWLALR